MGPIEPAKALDPAHDHLFWPVVGSGGCIATPGGASTPETNLKELYSSFPSYLLLLHPSLIHVLPSHLPLTAYPYSQIHCTPLPLAMFFGGSW